MTVIKKPDLTDPKLRAKLAKGMGHNYYGEPAWPNDLLYIFPVVILGTLWLHLHCFLVTCQTLKIHWKTNVFQWF